MASKREKTTKNIIYYVLVTAFGFVMLYPIFWMVGSSLKPEVEIFGYAARLFPKEWDWANYSEGWQGFGGTGFGVFFKNSFIVTILVVIGNLLTASIVAYGFARLHFKCKKILFACLMATVMLPSQMTLIPQYMMFHKLGWVNTFFPLIVPAFLGGGPFFIFLLVQFIRGIPKELDEAAIVDGCSAFGVYWRVILPLLKPALVTVGLFAFMWTWDDFLAPLVYLNKTELHTVTLGLRNFMDTTGTTNWGPLLAMSTLSLVPQLIIFTFFQKYLVKGIATTGLK